MKLFPLKISVQKRHFCNVACVQEDMRKKIKKKNEKVNPNFLELLFIEKKV